MFKVDNNNTGTSVSIVNFEQVNAGWVCPSETPFSFELLITFLRFFCMKIGLNKPIKLMKPILFGKILIVAKMGHFGTLTQHF